MWVSPQLFYTISILYFSKIKHSLNEANTFGKTTISSNKFLNSVFLFMLALLTITSKHSLQHWNTKLLLTNIDISVVLNENSFEHWRNKHICRFNIDRMTHDLTYKFFFLVESRILPKNILQLVQLRHDCWN